MKTTIIDKSLCHMNFSASADENSVKEYAVSLFKCGVDYIEIGSAALPFFENISTEFHYIYRIESVDDLKTMRGKEFAFITLPFDLLYLAPFTGHSVILEINVDDKPIYGDLNSVAGRFEMFFVSMVRFTGDFSDRHEEMHTFTQLFKRKTAYSIDYCPLDTSMNGTNSAIAAFNAHADAITLSFASKSVYTGLEKFLVTISFMYKEPFFPNFMIGLCLAALTMSGVSSEYFEGMNKVNEIMQFISERAVNIDAAKSNIQPVKHNPDRKSRSRSTPEERFYEAMQIEGEFQNELEKALEKSRLGLVNPTITNRARKKLQ